MLRPAAPSLVLLAYAGAGLLALFPLTPGGLGFVEAGLVGTLTLAGVSGPDALFATLASARLVLAADSGRKRRVPCLPSPLPVSRTV
jgi:uncharacterized membrane protein YbhN (UPF0104 family)